MGRRDVVGEVVVVVVGGKREADSLWRYRNVTADPNPWPANDPL